MFTFVRFSFAYPLLQTPSYSPSLLPVQVSLAFGIHLLVLSFPLVGQYSESRTSICVCISIVHSLSAALGIT